MRRRLTPLAVVLVMAAACAGQTAGPSSSATPSPSPTAAPTPVPSALPAPTALPTEKPADEVQPGAAGYSCQAQSGGPAQAGTPSVLRDARVGRHDSEGFDRFVLELDAATWSYEVHPQGSQFTRDPSGLTVTLQGSAGLRVVVRNAANHTEQGQPVETVLNSTPGFPALKQAAQLGDFEGVLTWGLGIADASHCFRSYALTAPSRLVIDVQR